MAVTLEQMQQWIESLQSQSQSQSQSQTEIKSTLEAMRQAGAFQAKASAVDSDDDNEANDTDNETLKQFAMSVSNFSPKQAEIILQFLNANHINDVICPHVTSHEPLSDISPFIVILEKIGHFTYPTQAYLLALAKKRLTDGIAFFADEDEVFKLHWAGNDVPSILTALSSYPEFLTRFIKDNEALIQQHINCCFGQFNNSQTPLQEERAAFIKELLVAAVKSDCFDTILNVIGENIQFLTSTDIRNTQTNTTHVYNDGECLAEVLDAAIAHPNKLKKIITQLSKFGCIQHIGLKYSGPDGESLSALLQKARETNTETFTFLVHIIEKTPALQTALRSKTELSSIPDATPTTEETTQYVDQLFPKPASFRETVTAYAWYAASFFVTVRNPAETRLQTLLTAERNTATPGPAATS